jgi:manganese/iron transport system permease protein
VLAAIRYLTEPFVDPFMQRALLIALLLAFLSGAVGVVVQLRRLSFTADAMTHAVFPGIAIAFFAGQSLFVGALLAGAAAAVLLTVATRVKRIDDDSFLALLLATFFSVGVVVVSRNHSFTADLTALLFGRILTVTGAQIAETAAVTAIVLAVLWSLRKEILLRAFDETAAAAMGYSVLAIDLVINAAIALVVVAAARAVGTALVVALVITPAAAARLVCRRVATMVALAVALGALGAWLGLLVSFDASVHHDVRLSPSATIVVALTLVFAVVAGVRATAIAIATRRRPTEAGA